MLENTTKLPEWDLSDLYDKPNSNAFEKDFELLKSLIDEFEKEYKDKILVDVNHIDLASKKIKKSIIAYEKIINLIGKLSAFATLHHVTATNDALRTKFYGDTQARITDIANKIIFYELELNKISDHTYKDLLNTELLIPYKTWFDNVRKYKPHQLTDEIEQIFQEKSITSFSAWNRLFDQTISNMKVNLNGEEKSLEEALNKLLSSSEEDRKTAFLAVTKKLEDNASLFTHIMNTICQDKSISDKWRKYDYSEQSRHLANNIEENVVNALVNAVENSYEETSHRYYKLKSKILGK